MADQPSEAGSGSSYRVAYDLWYSHRHALKDKTSVKESLDLFKQCKRAVEGKDFDTSNWG